MAKVAHRRERARASSSGAPLRSESESPLNGAAAHPSNPRGGMTGSPFTERVFAFEAGPRHNAEQRAEERRLWSFQLAVGRRRFAR